MIGNNVPVGAEGGIVRTPEGYQVAIAEGTLSREISVSITPLTKDQMGVPPLPESEDGWTFGAAFDLNLGDSPLAIPVQLAVPTSLEAGSRVVFYRITDFVADDGSVVKGYQEVETGYVDENGFARTLSGTHLGFTGNTSVGVYKVGQGIDQFEGVVNVQKKTYSDAVQTSAFVSTAAGGVFVGALNAGGAYTLNLPKSVTSFVTKLFNADTFDVIDSVVQLAQGLQTAAVNLYHTVSTTVSNLDPVVSSTSVEFTEVPGGDGTEPVLVVNGFNLANAPAAGEPDMSWVVFGDATTDAVNAALAVHISSAAAGMASYEDPIRIGSTYIVNAYEVSDTIIKVRVPRAVDAKSFRVARPDVSTYSFEEKKPSAQAQSSGVSGMFKDTRVRLSASAALQATGKFAFAAVERGISQPDGEELTTTIGNIDQLAVIGERILENGTVQPALVGRIPIGYLDDEGKTDTTKGSAQPNAVAMTRDNARIYVGLSRAGGIAAVDGILMRQIDVDPETEGVNFIELKNAPDARIGDVIIDRYNRFLLAADRNGGRIYVIGIDPDSESTYHKHVATLTLPNDWDISSLTMTPDWRELVVAQTDRSSRQVPNGLVSIVEMPDLTTVVALSLAKHSAPVNLEPTITFGGIDGDSGIRFRDPQQVVSRIATEDGKARIVVLDAQKSTTLFEYPGQVAVFLREGGSWQIETAMNFGFTPVNPRNPFDVRDPTEIVFSPDGTTAYVIGQKRLDVDNLKRDPNEELPVYSNVYNDNPAGSNIAIINNLFGKGVSARLRNCRARPA